MATRRSSSAFCLLLSSAYNASRTSKHVLNRSALQRRASCAFKRPASIPAPPFVVTLGNVQRDGLRCAPYDAHLRCAQALILRVTLSFRMLAVALGPADRLDGRTVYVALLMTEWHRAFSLSIPIPIPIPIATPTPIALRRCLDSVVSVIHEPLLSHCLSTPAPSAIEGRQSPRAMQAAATG
jgi:hypothetical protein